MGWVDPVTTANAKFSIRKYRDCGLDLKDRIEVLEDSDMFTYLYNNHQSTMSWDYVALGASSGEIDILIVRFRKKN